MKKARQYLNSSGFSRTGLIKQLNYEGFSNDDSIYAVDSINANWSEQAVRKAAQYLKSSGFSRSGLIKQLVYEGFSNSDSQNAADTQKADWFDQAVRKAAQYLKSSAFSRSSLIKQLEYEGFSNSEATYGADSNGFASTPPVKPSQNGSSSSNSNSSTTSSGTPVVGKIISNSKWTAFEVTNPSKTENLTSPSFTVLAATSTGVVLIEARNDKFPMLKAGEKIWMYFPGFQPDVITLTKYPRSSNRPTNPDEWPAVRDAKISGSNIEFTLVNNSKTLRLSGESIFHYFGLDSSGVPVFADQVKTYQTLLPGGSTTISWPTTVSSIKHSSVVVYIGPVYE